MEIPETLDAGSIRLRRWTVDRAEDLNDAEKKAPRASGTHLVWALATARTGEDLS